MRIDLPVDKIRHSRKIWNHVDELRIDPGLAGRLARNGLRVGVASIDAWPAIHAIISACGARSRDEQLIARGGLPISIEVGSIEGGESIFSYTADNRLVGKTFSAGNKLVNVGYAYQPELGAVVDLQLNLEVRHDRGVMTWESKNGIIQQVPAYDRHVFGNLEVVLRINPDEVLILGPGEEAENEHLVGGRFYTHQRGGRRYESLLCITPRPFQSRRVYGRAE